MAAAGGVGLRSPSGSRGGAAVRLPGNRAPRCGRWGEAPEGAGGGAAQRGGGRPGVRGGSGGRASRRQVSASPPGAVATDEGPCGVATLPERRRGAVIVWPWFPFACCLSPLPGWERGEASRGQAASRHGRGAGGGPTRWPASSGGSQEEWQPPCCWASPSPRRFVWVVCQGESPCVGSGCCQPASPLLGVAGTSKGGVLGKRQTCCAEEVWGWESGSACCNVTLLRAG